MRNGYKMVYAPEHHRADSSGCVYEHIIVAEQILGRLLADEEVVHHIDHNRSNNSPDNLMIFHSGKDHTCFHYGADVFQIDGVWYATPIKHIKICELLRYRDPPGPLCIISSTERACGYGLQNASSILA